MSDDPFVSAIRADWLDRATRLAYADWLEERGDPRAEVVRVCEAMRAEPVWSDRYWELKARRNELWTRVPLEWLEATGYDGSYYDPIFRDGVPDDPLGRWRLIREFTERWHGVAAPDVGGQQDAIRAAEERLGMTLPPSVREFVAYEHDLGDGGTPTYDGSLESLFHCAYYRLVRPRYHSGVGLIFFTLDESLLGVAEDNLGSPDPPTYFFSERLPIELEYETPGYPPPAVPPPSRFESSLSLSVFRALETELPAAGHLNARVLHTGDLLTRLAAEFPIHCRFDNAEVFETDEMLVVVVGTQDDARTLTALVRRPIPVGPIREYLQQVGDRHTMTSGLFGPENFRRQQEEASRHPDYRPPPRWMNVFRRAVERALQAEELRNFRESHAWLQDTDSPHSEDGDDIPF